MLDVVAFKFDWEYGHGLIIYSSQNSHLLLSSLKLKKTSQIFVLFQGNKLDCSLIAKKISSGKIRKATLPGQKHK